MEPSTSTALKQEKAESEEETWPTQYDPYMILEGEECGQEDKETNEKDEPVSKRAMQRALRGWTRRSGGWKHKKKAAGKGPAKGVGKNAAADWSRCTWFVVTVTLGSGPGCI